MEAQRLPQPMTPQKREEEDNNNPSALSRFFASMRTAASPEQRIESTLADVVDSASKSMHLSSMKHRPSAQALLEGQGALVRQETLVWLVQAFDVMHFNDNLLFDTQLLLDRYYSSPPLEDNHNGASQRKLLAAVCIALKTGSPVDTQMPLRQVVMHLGRDQVPFDEVLAAELAILKKLRFVVGTPTAKEFLEALSTRLGNDRISAAGRSLADFLLQLTLVDATLHYRYAHLFLAAASLFLALHATRAPPAAYLVVLEDLNVHSPDALTMQGVLMQCCAALHCLWTRCVNGNPHEQNLYARHLCAKFARVGHNQVSTLAPPQFPPSSLPPVQSWCPPGLQQDDVEEAVSCVHQSLTLDAPSGKEEPRRHSRCPRCSGLWLLPEPSNGVCPECGVLVEVLEDAQWAVSLANRLRSLAESSWKVRCVLVRHNWANGRFRRPPDREQLLRDLVRAGACVQPKRTASRGPSKAREVRLSGASVSTASANSRDLATRRRAASCGGQRCSSSLRSTCSVNMRSP